MCGPEVMKARQPQTTLGLDTWVLEAAKKFGPIAPSIADAETRAFLDRLYILATASYDTRH